MSYDNIYLKKDNFPYIFSDNIKIDDQTIYDFFYKKDGTLQYIFNNEVQNKIFSMLDNNNKYSLFSASTGLGKTSKVPLMLYKFLKERKTKNPKILISEPRRAVAISTAQYMMKNTGHIEIEDKEIKLDLNEIVNRDNIQEIFNKNKKNKSKNKNFEIENNSDEEKIIDQNQSFKRNIEEKDSFISWHIGQNSNNNEFIQRRTKDNGRTFIRFCTDGILWDKIKHGENDIVNFFNGFDLIIFDEVHENSLDTIFTLIILSQLFREKKLPNLQIILITASLREEEINVYDRMFDNLKRVDLKEGTQWSISEENIDIKSILDICYRKYKVGENGLIFLSGRSDILRYKKNIEEKIPDKNLCVVPFSTSFNDENYGGEVEAFLNLIVDQNMNYIVLSTSVGESSITYPKLKYVIDIGQRNYTPYDYKTKITEDKNKSMITFNSYIQRKGRVGRKEDGDYLYTYDKLKLVDYQNRLLTENIDKRLLELISIFQKTKRLNKLLGSFIEFYKDLPEDFIITYLNDFYKIGFITDPLNPEITRTYINIKKLRDIKELSMFDLPVFSFLYYYPKREIVELILMIKSNAVYKYVTSEKFELINNSGIESVINMIKRNDGLEIIEGKDKNEKKGDKFKERRNLTNEVFNKLSQYETNEIMFDEAIILSLYFNRTYEPNIPNINFKTNNHFFYYIPLNISNQFYLVHQI